MIHDFLIALVHERANAAGWAWFERALATATHGTRDELLTVYTAASSRIERARVAFSGDELRTAAALEPDLRFDQWMLEDAARAAMLVRRGSAHNDAAYVDSALACFESGDTREQLSWLRAVSVLPGAERFLPSVVDACRTNILPLFEAIACENPYPMRYFPERNFNQMILKALFNNVALSRVVGLPGRLNRELARMAGDYASERRAAGRSVPADISQAMIPSHPAQEPSR